MGQQVSLIAELEGAIASGSSDKRVETLRRVTDLFLSGADRMTGEQVGVFDDVLGRLIANIESRALAELSGRLAPVDNAPVEVIRKLARADEIDVAGPILSQSTRLSSNDLVEIARAKGERHMLAISARKQLDEAVTDVLVDRGGREVVRTLARNAGARFSETGFASLVRNAENDESLAEQVGLRADLPAGMRQELLQKATEAVRQRLLQHAPPEAAADIRRVLVKIVGSAGPAAKPVRNYEAAKKTVQRLEKQGELNEAALARFIEMGKFEELTVGLAALCSASTELIESLLSSDRNDAVLVPCKAAGIKWPTVSAMLKHRPANHAISEQAMAQARSDYLTLSQASALRIMRFWQVRNGAKKEAR